MEFEPRQQRSPAERGRGPQAPEIRPLLALTTRLQLQGCNRCGGALVWDDLEEQYHCLQCGARV